MFFCISCIHIWNTSRKTYGDYSEEKCYQERLDIHIVIDYCWMPKSENGNMESRKRPRRSIKNNKNYFLGQNCD